MYLYKLIDLVAGH